MYPASSSKGIHPKKKRNAHGGTVTLAAGACKGKATRGGGGAGRLPKQGVRGCPWSTRIHRLQGPPLNDLWIRHQCRRRPRKTGVIRGCRSSHLPNITVKMLFFLHTRERRQKTVQCSHCPPAATGTPRSGHARLFRSQRRRPAPARQQQRHHPHYQPRPLPRQEHGARGRARPPQCQCQSAEAVPEVGPAAAGLPEVGSRCRVPRPQAKGPRCSASRGRSPPRQAVHPSQRRGQGPKHAQYRPGSATKLMH